MDNLMITANFTDDTFNMMIIPTHEFTMQMFSYPETQSRRQAEGIINCAAKINGKGGPAL